MGRKWDGMVPLNKDDQVMDWPFGAVAWRTAVTWEDQLSFRHFTRGRSSVRAVMFSHARGHNVSVFFNAFEELVPHMIQGSVIGTFKEAKRGRSYGVDVVSVKASRDLFDG